MGAPGLADLEGLRAAPIQDADLKRARSLLQSARGVVILTGAGVSAESGVPTFRGPDGLWKSFRPEDLATPEAFRRDPRLVWEWYAWRQARVSACAPNAAHYAIAELVRARADVRLVTQNVDGLHARAADGTRGGASTDDEAPLELHGSLFRVRCTRCPFRGRLEEAVDASSADTLPRCGECNGLLRPDVVWFGEALDEAVLKRAFQLASGAELCLIVGTSALVHPAASLPLVTARAGGRLVEVNPERTPLTSACALSLAGPAAVILPALAS